MMTRALKALPGHARLAHARLSRAPLLIRGLAIPRLAYPGMVFSMLLASPAFASASHGGASHRDHHTEPAGPRRVSEGRVSEARVSEGSHRRAHEAASPQSGGVSHRATLSQGLGHAVARMARAGGRVTAATRARRGAREENVAMLSDATLWTKGAAGGSAAGDAWADRIAREDGAPPDHATGTAPGNATGSTKPVQPAASANAGGAEMNTHAHIIQVGMASWYGGTAWQGKRMSSGARYDEAELTAAHATLPLGSKVLVSLAGGTRSVVVTITDRPGTRKRIIDLSRAAAAQLGILDRGIATVALAPL
jgi:hypothetical protein